MAAAVQEDHTPQIEVLVDILSIVDMATVGMLLTTVAAAILAAAEME